MEDCAFPCTGDSSLVCGGYDSFQAFQYGDAVVEPPAGYLGCFIDAPARVFSAPFVASDTNTAEVRVRLCVCVCVFSCICIDRANRLAAKIRQAFARTKIFEATLFPKGRGRLMTSVCVRPMRRETTNSGGFRANPSAAFV